MLPVALRPRVEARREGSAETDALDRPASRALDDHDLADAVGPRLRSTDDQGRRDKKSDHEQQGQNPKSESHPVSLECEDPFLDP